jgi:hypothetical protein
MGTPETFFLVDKSDYRYIKIYEGLSSGGCDVEISFSLIRGKQERC